MSKELVCEVFPAWVYHKTNPEGRLVHSADELKALGKGWVDSPADCKPAESGECKLESPDDIELETKPKKKK